MPRHVQEVTAPCLLKWEILHECQARNRVWDRHECYAMARPKAWKEEESEYINTNQVGPGVFCCIGIEVDQSIALAHLRPQRYRSFATMKFLAAAVLSLLPALTSAHCVAQRVRVNGQVIHAC